jgi:DNA-binding MarR family transcriptional regulator
MTPACETLPQRADNVLLQMFRTGHAVRDLMAHAVAGTGVSGDEWAVLSAVGVFRSVAPTQLATVLRIPPTSISRYVARLVSLDLVVRVPNEADRRSYLLELTEEGRSKVEAISPRFRALVTGLEEHADVRAIESALVELEQAAKALSVDTVTADR